MAWNLHKWGYSKNSLWLEPLMTVVCGYMFFIDISTRIWWDTEEVWWRALGYITIYSLRRSLRIAELISVKSTFYSVTNYAPGKPFDSFVLSGPGKPIYIFPSFHRRRELEELLLQLYNKRPETFTDPLVTDFINGEFTKWWPSR